MHTRSERDNLAHSRQKTEELERQLQESREHLQLIEQAANIGIFEWNIPSGVITWTKEAEALYGLEPGSFGGNFAAWERCVHPDDLPEARKQVFEAVEKKINLDIQFRVIWPTDGSAHWIYAKGRTFYEKQGEPLRMIGINIDITERKSLERQKDDFIGVVSHELRTPVTSIKIFAQILYKRFTKAGDHQNADLLAKMDAQIDKLTKLISDLIDITRMEAGKLELHETEFDLASLTDEIIEEIQRTTARHVIAREGRLETCVRADRDRIGQVLMNLLSNAIKYSPCADTIVVRISSDGEQAIVQVQDFGVGIPREKQEQIFQRFYRVRGKNLETISGLGLGLYISAEMIRRHGGDIWFESESGHGATFSFKIPFQNKASEIT